MSVNGNRASIDISFEKKSPVLPPVIRSERPVVVVGENLKIQDVTEADALSSTGITATDVDAVVSLPEVYTSQKVLDDDNKIIVLKFGGTSVVLEYDSVNITWTKDSSNFITGATVKKEALVSFIGLGVTVVSPIQVYIGARYLDAVNSLTVTAVTAETYETYTGTVTSDSNPLGFAVMLATSIQTTASTYFIGLDNCDPVTGKGGYEDYKKAFTKLAKDKTTYYIVPLTQDYQTITYMKGYLKNLAQRRKEKRAILVPEIPTKEQPTQVGTGTSIQRVSPSTYVKLTEDTTTDDIVFAVRTVVSGSTFNGYHVTAEMGTPADSAKASVELNTLTNTFAITILSNATVAEVRAAINASGLLEMGVLRELASGGTTSESAIISDIKSGYTIPDLADGSDNVKYITYVGSVTTEFINSAIFENETYKDQAIQDDYFVTIEGYPRKFYLAGETTGTPAVYDGAGVDIDFNGVVLAEDASAYGNPVVTEDETIWKESTNTLDLTDETDRAKIVDYGIMIAQQSAYARIIYMWGEKIVLFNTEYDFYYAAVILAAQMSSLAVGVSLTEFNFPIATNVTKTNDTFDDDTELRDLRAAGWWVLVKDDESEPVKTSLQYTTDTSSLKMAESTTIQCLDTVAKRYRNTLTPILGRYNVNDPATISTVVAPSTEAVRTTLLSDKVVLSINILKIAPATLPGEEDTMLVIGEATVGQTMNRMRFTFYI